MKKSKIKPNPINPKHQIWDGVGATTSRPFFEELAKENKAITLVALVITIIILLILAGVTINLTIGERGIFNTAQQAVRNYKDAQEKELADLADFENIMNSTINALEANPEMPNIPVTNPLTSVTLSKTTGLTSVGNTIPISAEVYPPNADDTSITWDTSNLNVATISNGVITGVGGGRATITATSASGIEAKCEVIVVNYGTSIQDSYETVYTTMYPSGIPNGTGEDSYSNGNCNSINYFLPSESTVINSGPFTTISDTFSIVSQGDNTNNFTQSIGNRWVYVSFYAAGGTHGASLSNVKLIFENGTSCNVNEAVESGYIEPLVLCASTNSVTEGRLWVDALNILSGGSTNEVWWPRLYLTFKVKTKSNLEGISFYTNINWSNEYDGLKVRGLPEDFEASINPII